MTFTGMEKQKTHSKSTPLYRFPHYHFIIFEFIVNYYLLLFTIISLNSSSASFLSVNK